MDGVTADKVEEVLASLARVRSYRCRYQDLSSPPEIDAGRIVEIEGDREGAIRLSTIRGLPEIETVITERELVRIDRSTMTGYRIDFTRHPFTEFHRYGWFCIDRPFSLIAQSELLFRAEAREAPPVLLFQGTLNPSIASFGQIGGTVPPVQLKIDERTGLLRELLVASAGKIQRFLFYDFVVNRRSAKRRPIDASPGNIGDMTDIYWNQICNVQGGEGPPDQLFTWN